VSGAPRHQSSDAGAKPVGTTQPGWGLFSAPGRWPMGVRAATISFFQPMPRGNDADGGGKVDLLRGIPMLAK